MTPHPTARESRRQALSECEAATETYRQAEAAHVHPALLLRLAMRVREKARALKVACDAVDAEEGCHG